MNSGVYNFNMNLQNANIKTIYFLDTYRPYEFYDELYRNSLKITFALGYFSSSAFNIGVEGILSFINNGGYLRILCNDKLFQQDINAITDGYSLRETSSITIDAVQKLFAGLDEYNTFGFKCISLLIALNRLDIKILQADALVHFKIGYAEDGLGNTISFDGSVNYTISGLLFNNEQLHTTKSWNNDCDNTTVKHIQEKIDNLWNEKYPEYTTISGDKLKELILEQFPVRDSSELNNEFAILKKHYLSVLEIENNLIDMAPSFFSIPKSVKPFEHQLAAIINWENHNYQTIFAMATGTGKTLAAIFAINNVEFSKKITSILIIVPLIDLISQWKEDLERFYNGRIVNIEGTSSWEKELINFSLQNIYNNEKLIIIATYASYSKKQKEILSYLDIKKTIIVADEVHRFGSLNLLTKLPLEIRYRIGLSATPEREYDIDGTDAIFDYFCPHKDPFIITIEDAIRLKLLCEYNYYPQFVELTDSEIEEYASLSVKIRQLSASQVNKHHERKKEKDETIELLLKKRHRIIEQARNKLIAFQNLIEELVRTSHPIKNAVMYVPEGMQDDKSVIDEYTKVLWDIAHVRIAKYTQNASKQILEDFKEGRIDVLAAKKRLDEGINIPAITQAFFISSSTVEREFVQRRGRILRKTQTEKIAEIFDFLVIPSRDSDLSINDADIKSMKSGEIKRANIFVENAKNHFEAKRKIDDFY